MALGQVSSAGGGVRVTTTDRGLPTSITIDAAELRRAPDDLAREILLLSRVSAMRAQVRMRRALTSQGVADPVIGTLGLATEDELAEAEDQLRGADEAAPDSWLRPV
ncbi:hypothetical protein [Mycolicibacterium sp. CBMA 226]|uniref:hypothetical protein n=1 Tax=Mycolicibacterium sp. CBMA 226 TaxID=2606611 RepID=UPI001FB6229A|nr:hypothetical protein [Mycolicibacterium sp. CBMA 226]